jgi:hypothetical protein
MNQEKAREFFSSYYEGSLEPGLQLAFEQKMKTDPDLRADYEAFADTVRGLDLLKAEEIEIPIYLSDRIASRLEDAIQARKPRFWDISRIGSSWKTAIAAVAIIGAVGSVVFLHPGSATAGALGGGGSTSGTEQGTVSFNASGQDVTFHAQLHKGEAVVVASGTSGDVINTFPAQVDTTVNSDLKNPWDSAKLFSVQVKSSYHDQIVAVPGVSPKLRANGEGSVGEFAAALADYYHTPVLLDNILPQTQVKWAFNGSDALKSATDALTPAGLTAVVQKDGLIAVTDH